MPRDLWLACTDGDSVDVAMYVALHTTVDLDGLYDLIELQQVHASWKNAANMNAQETP